MPNLFFNGKQFAYQKLGKGFPILFGHSYLWSASMWHPQIEAFSGDYCCIIPELWGHGNSDSLPMIPYSIEDLADIHCQLLDKLKIESCILIGLSVGGMWGTQLALKHPERVSGLVLMDTSVASEPLKTQQQYFSMADTVEKLGRFPESMVEQILPLFFAPATLQTRSSLVENFKQQLLNWPPEKIPSIVALSRTIFSRESLMERLGELPMPTLVMVGEDDRSRPPHEAKAMADVISRGEYVVIPQAGHLPNLEQPRVVNQILHNFFNSLE
jgi:pimeloyl-ACP methyl ester carboxylesterase